MSAPETVPADRPIDVEVDLRVARHHWSYGALRVYAAFDGERRELAALEEGRYGVTIPPVGRTGTFELEAWVETMDGRRDRPRRRAVEVLAPGPSFDLTAGRRVCPDVALGPPGAAGGDLRVTADGCLFQPWWSFENTTHELLVPRTDDRMLVSVRVRPDFFYPVFVALAALLLGLAMWAASHRPTASWVARRRDRRGSFREAPDALWEVWDLEASKGAGIHVVRLGPIGWARAADGCALWDGGRLVKRARLRPGVVARPAGEPEGKIVAVLLAGAEGEALRDGHLEDPTPPTPAPRGPGSLIVMTLAVYVLAFLPTWAIEPLATVPGAVVFVPIAGLSIVAVFFVTRLPTVDAPRGGRW